MPTAKCVFAAGALGTAAAVAAIAQDALLPGPGADLTQAKCVVCHEIGHVTRVRQSRAEWLETMRVMVVRGAPLTADETRIITDYLATYYNRESPPPATAAASPESVDPIMQVLNRNACLGCHAVDRLVVGPPFRAVAAKYQGDASAPPRLVRKVKEGGYGVWGPVPMPPNPNLSEADAKQVIDWVLGQR